MDHRSELRETAQLMERANRLDDMMRYVTELVEVADATQTPFSQEERGLFLVAFKNSLKSLRTSLHSVWAVERVEEAVGNERTFHLAHSLRVKLELELVQLCLKAVRLVDSLLAIPLGEGKIFFKKFKADSLRYLAEVRGEEHVLAARKEYLEAWNLAEVELGPTDSLRLGLALNMAVFHYDVLKKPDAACVLARRAFEAAVATPTTKMTEDSLCRVQLLRDNLTRWTSSSHDGGHHPAATT